MAAVAEATDTLVSQPRREVTFAARRESLRLVHTTRYDVRGPAGQKVDETRGIVIAFQDGMLRLPIDGVVTTEQGNETEVGPILEWLAKHRLNGNHDEGFFEVPQASPPVSADEMEAITDAAMELDVERLERLIGQEQAGWSRPEILKTAERAKAKALEVREQFEQQMAAQAAEAPATKKAPAK